MPECHPVCRRVPHGGLGHQGPRRGAQGDLADRPHNGCAHAHRPHQGVSLRTVEESRQPDRPPAGRSCSGGPGEQDPLSGLPLEGAVPSGVPAPRQRSHPSTRCLVLLGTTVSHSGLRRAPLPDPAAPGVHRRHSDQRRTLERTDRVDQHQAASPYPHGLRVQVHRQPHRAVPARPRWLLPATTRSSGCCVIHPRICQESPFKSPYYTNPITRELWNRAAAALDATKVVVLIGYSLPITDLVFTAMLRENVHAEVKAVSYTNWG